MGKESLKVQYVEQKSPAPTASSSKTNRRIERQAILEREWLENPEQFSPTRDLLQIGIYNSTTRAIDSLGPLQNKKAADLGCGEGHLARYMAERGAAVDAVDISTKALEAVKKYQEPNINPIHDYLPDTRLPDTAYDLVLCADTMAYLHKNEYRWLMAELARLVKSDGHVIVSTPFDVNTEDALEAFTLLGETEFTIEQWFFNYDRLLIKILKSLDTPKFYSQMHLSPLKRSKEKDKRKGLSQKWFLLNSTPILAILWKGVSFLTTPLAHLFRHSALIHKTCARFSKVLWQEEGISHALFVGKKRPIDFPLPRDEQPRELKEKKHIWE